eukprot:14348091-Ditylum_brightwellii.AAC.1
MFDWVNLVRALFYLVVVAVVVIVAEDHHHSKMMMSSTSFKSLTEEEKGTMGILHSMVHGAGRIRK